MNLENTIQASFDHYPELCQTRKQVLDQLFCVIGNGFEWRDGELIDNNLKKPINNLDENGKAKQYHIITKSEHRKNMYELIKNDSEKLRLWENRRLKNGESLEQRFLSQKEDDEEQQYIEKEIVYPLCLNYSYLFNYPEDIKPDWLKGIQEIFEYIIENISEDAIVCKDIKIFREISKAELIDLYNKKFKNK